MRPKGMCPEHIQSQGVANAFVLFGSPDGKHGNEEHPKSGGGNEQPNRKLWAKQPARPETGDPGRLIGSLANLSPDAVTQVRGNVRHREGAKTLKKFIDSFFVHLDNHG